MTRDQTSKRAPLSLPAVNWFFFVFLLVFFFFPFLLPTRLSGSGFRFVPCFLGFFLFSPIFPFVDRAWLKDSVAAGKKSVSRQRVDATSLRSALATCSRPTDPEFRRSRRDVEATFRFHLFVFCLCVYTFLARKTRGPTNPVKLGKTR